MYYFYIIYSQKLDRYYTGHTENLSKRIQEHKNGMSRYTSKALDWKVVYSLEFESRELARKKEFEVKRKKSRKHIEWIIGDQ